MTYIDLAPGEEPPDCPTCGEPLTVCSGDWPPHGEYRRCYWTKCFGWKCAKRPSWPSKPGGGAFWITDVL